MGESAKLHVVFLPYFTPSHMIPLVDAARLFAARGVKVTIITTPANAALFQSSTNYEVGLGHEIIVRILQFPAAEVGLPEGIENFSAATSMEFLGKVYQGVLLLRKPIEELILDITPHCIFSDMFFPWTVDVADKLKIPRLLFYPNNFVSHVLPHNMDLYGPHVNVKSESESFLIPGLPDKIEMKRSQLEEHLKTTESVFRPMLKEIKDSELRSFGMVHDTIYELEAAYAEYYKKVRQGKRYYTIGPLFHISNREKASNNSSAKRHGCLDWLDNQEPNKVLFICFGSIIRFTGTQLKEIALALEASNQPFVWVARSKENEQENWMPDGFEERIVKSNKGYIIRGWAPQLMILRHPAVGGFMTHCGWNSLLEAITSGVPLITWPLFAEQFYNEKLIEVLEFGVRVGSDVWHPTPDAITNVVGSKQIEEAIKRLMYPSEESEKIRHRAKEGAAMVKRAVEVGGSSQQNLEALIEEIKSCTFGAMTS